MKLDNNLLFHIWLQTALQNHLWLDCAASFGQLVPFSKATKFPENKKKSMN